MIGRACLILFVAYLILRTIISNMTWTDTIYRIDTPNNTVLHGYVNGKKMEGAHCSGNDSFAFILPTRPEDKAAHFKLVLLNGSSIEFSQTFGEFETIDNRASLAALGYFKCS